MICMDCKRSYPDNGTTIRCICRQKYQASTEQVRPYDPEWPCELRGPELGILDCGCQGKPKVWSCPLHGVCAARKLRPEIAGYANMDGVKVAANIHFCNRCPNRK